MRRGSFFVQHLRRPSSSNWTLVSANSDSTLYRGQYQVGDILPCVACERETSRKLYIHPPPAGPRRPGAPPPPPLPPKQTNSPPTPFTPKSPLHPYHLHYHLYPFHNHYHPSPIHKHHFDKSSKFFFKRWLLLCRRDGKTAVFMTFSRRKWGWGGNWGGRGGSEGR